MKNQRADYLTWTRLDGEPMKRFVVVLEDNHPRPRADFDTLEEARQYWEMTCRHDPWYSILDMTTGEDCPRFKD